MPSKGSLGMVKRNKKMDHSLFVSETGTGLLVSFVPHNNENAAEHPNVVDSSLLEPSSGNKYHNEGDRDYLNGSGSNQDVYSDGKNLKKAKNSLMGTIKSISSKMMGLRRENSL
jgi:hypothetical protein